MFIRSERLFLRPGWPEDWSELLALIDDVEVVKNLARAPWPYTADHARDFASREQDLRFPHFFVTLPGATGPGGAGTKLIGSVGLAQGESGETEFGYWIARNQWGKGYATEAARAVLSLARTLGHRHLNAGHFIDNPASGRVLAKVGFRKTGAIGQRFSVGRGHEVASVEHTIDLGAASDCDGGDSGPAMRAA